MRRDPLEFFKNCAKTYGNLYRFRAFHLFVLVNDPALVFDVFVRQSYAIKRSRRAHEIRVALGDGLVVADDDRWRFVREALAGAFHPHKFLKHRLAITQLVERDRKSTRLNSSHLGISYAVFCLKKKNKKKEDETKYKE